MSYHLILKSLLLILNFPLLFLKDDSKEVNDEVQSQLDTEETIYREETTETTDLHVEIQSQFFYNDAFIKDEENNFVFISD